MIDKIYIFTETYPFGNTSETVFLNQELPITSQIFKEVIIVPKIIDPKLKKTNNYYSINMSFSVLQKKMKFINLLPILISKDILVEIIYLLLLGNTNKLRRLWWSLRTIKAVDTWVKTTISPHENVFLYSYWFSDVTTGLAYSKNRFPRIKIITRAHRFDLYEDQTKYGYFPLRKFTMRKIDRIFPISEDGQNYLKNKFPQFENKIKVFRLGVEPQGKMTLPSVEENQITIVSCAYIRPVKRIDFICEVLYLVAKSLPGKVIHWHHFGGGELDEVLKYQEDLSNIAPNFKGVFYGNVPNEFIVNFYKSQSVDFFISLSSSEGIPMSMMEAASFGIPIVSTNVGGINELVTPQNGLLLTSIENSQKMSEEITKFIIEKQYIKKRENIYQTWELKFSSIKNYSKFGQYLQTI